MYLFLKTEDNRTDVRLTDMSGATIAEKTITSQGDLANRLLLEIDRLLSNRPNSYQALSGIAVFKGPAKFTNLRICHTVANTLSYSLGIPAVNAGGQDWKKTCLAALPNAPENTIVVPEYGSLPKVTKPKK